MNTEKSFRINKFLKPVPIIIYYLMWVLELHRTNGMIRVPEIVSGLILGTFALAVEGWGLICLEVLLFVRLQRKAQIVWGILTIVFSALSALARYSLSVFIFSFAGFWTMPMVLLLCMNFVYILIAALILGGKLRTR